MGTNSNNNQPGGVFYPLRIVLCVAELAEIDSFLARDVGRCSMFYEGWFTSPDKDARLA